MNESEIKKWIKFRVDEFVPVRIHLSNDQQFELTHPEAALVGKFTTVILINGEHNLIGNVHINRIEPLATANAS
jgi:hypothetical protein